MECRTVGSIFGKIRPSVAEIWASALGRAMFDVRSIFFVLEELGAAGGKAATKKKSF